MHQSRITEGQRWASRRKNINQNNFHKGNRWKAKLNNKDEKTHKPLTKASTSDIADSDRSEGDMKWKCTQIDKIARCTKAQKLHILIWCNMKIQEPSQVEENAVIKGKLLRGDRPVLIQGIWWHYCYNIKKKLSEGDNSAFVHTSHQKKNLIFNRAKESLYIKTSTFLHCLLKPEYACQ